jgi:hypothetical protein
MGRGDKKNKIDFLSIDYIGIGTQGRIATKGKKERQAFF